MFFCNSNQVNISGLKTFGCIKACLARCVLLFGVKIDVQSVIVDNSTSSGCLGKSINLWELKNFLDQDKRCESAEGGYTLSLRPTDFPAGVLRCTHFCRERRERKRDNKKKRALLRSLPIGSLPATDKSQAETSVIEAGGRRKFLSMLLFENGKYVILGGKSRQEIESTWRKFLALMNRFSMTMKRQDSLCVWDVEL